MPDINGYGMDLGALQFAARNDRPGRSLESLAASAQGPNGFDMEAARQVAEEFEATFLAILVDTMFVGVETDGPFGGGQSEEMFRSLLNQEYAKVMARQGGLGLADHVLATMIEMQEGG